MASFNQVLASISRSGKSLRNNVQTAVVMALDHYAKHGDTAYLNKLMEVAQATRAIRTATLKAFIQAHANVSYVKAKDGSKVFKKQGKEVQVKEVASPWWEYNKQGEATPDFDVLAQAKAFATRLQKALEGEGRKVKSGQEETAKKALEALQSLLA